jgi:hypothetical protein
LKRINLFFILPLLCVALLTAFPGVAPADTEMPPADYTKETEDGTYVFVMLAPDRLEWAAKNNEIRQLYKHSGLYKKDGVYEPLWQVFWYSFTVYPSSDGKHVVRMGPWAKATSDLAIAFYEDGKELKQYAVSDLVKDLDKLRHTVSHFFWRTDLSYDDKEGTVFLKTVDGISYTFSVKTGEIIDNK